jgi:hypothetical protein
MACDLCGEHRTYLERLLDLRRRLIALERGPARY